MSALVSIVIPTYNAGVHLQEAVSSALAQDYENVEVIVVDNASTDSCTEALLTVEDDRLRVVRFESLVPADRNWTRSVEMARGDFIKLLCADDAILRGSIRMQVDQLVQAPSAGLAAGRRRIVRESGAVIREAWGLGRLRGLVAGHTAIRSCVVSGANLLGEPAAVLFRADALRSCMPWSPTAGYVIDVELYLRVLGQADLWASQEPVSIFRVSSGSWSARVANRQAEDFSAMIDQARDRWPEVVSATDAHRGRLGARARQGLRGVVYLTERIGKVGRSDEP